jgi:iron complex transport system ATP-binding protein
MGMMAGAAIMVHDISFRYGNTPILEDIGFQVRAGTVTALIGPNGSGKTTLLRIMAGLLTPASGTIAYGDAPASNENRAPGRNHVGFVPQGQRTAFPFSCFDVVLTGRHAFVPVYLTPTTTDETIAMQALTDVGAGFLADRPYTRISGGERQLVLIARALAAEPGYLLLDEPTTFLDIRNQAAVLNLVRNLAHNRGITTIMSIHDPTQAAAYADDILVLGRSEHAVSRLIAQGSAESVFTREILETAFGIPVRIIQSDDGIAVLARGD